MPWITSAHTGTLHLFNSATRRKNKPVFGHGVVGASTGQVGPLLQPNVEIMIAIAMIVAPHPEKLRRGFGGDAIAGAFRLR